MCLICIDFQKEVLTATEAWRNLQEMKSTMTDEHYDDVVKMLVDRLYDEQHGEEFVDLVESLEEEELFFFLDEKEPELDFDQEENGWTSDYYGSNED
tara:strand:+ start:786 stop:1076 length:291 start_codon:yes stop_codon:yes gene_type:complete